MKYLCCDNQRRQFVKDSASFNGIDYLEVLDHIDISDIQWQRILQVHFLNELHLATLTTENVQIKGGERIRDIRVESVSVDPVGDPQVLTVTVNKPGDFSPYLLCLVQGPDTLEPPGGFDPFFSTLEFSFKVNCPREADCRPQKICVPSPSFEPEINYLAKDYASFRNLLLDRMSMLMPDWQERNPADMGIMLVELLAYIGDQLSYEQDAVATEAYLDTARRRVSVRRHARLVDYYMHDGCNARTWVQIQVNTDNVELKKGTILLSKISHLGPVISPNSAAFAEALNQHPVIFETMEDGQFFEDHNKIEFYTWGNTRCCLPKGATEATLRKNLPNLKVGDVLIFEEVLGPHTGKENDSNPAYRHPVRLVKVQAFDSNKDPLLDPLNNQEVIEITEIAWDREDALPFPLCISSRTPAEPNLENVSVARGNIVLADHGMTLKNEPLDTVPQPFFLPQASQNRCQEQDPLPIFPRYRPTLKEGPLTQAASYEEKVATGPASLAMQWSMRDVFPEIFLVLDPQSADREWEPTHDLLSSKGTDKKFVVEIESDGITSLRFGDGQHGTRPDPESQLFATYRMGNGISGNIGADSLAHVVSEVDGITAVRNPLPASGGIEPETMEEVRQNAPVAFRTQERAVTEEDYSMLSLRHPDIQRAAGTFRWTGSWHTAFVTVDRFGGWPVDNEFETTMRQHLEPFRMAGYDLEVDAPRIVPLELEMQVCVQPGFFRSQVKSELLDRFSNRILPGGRRGLFHPDNFTFGQPVYLSPLYAAAQAIPGVASVMITTFQRLHTPDSQPLQEGKLSVGRLEIARLDNDPNFLERGVFHLQLFGGQ